MTDNVYVRGTRYQVDLNSKNIFKEGGEAYLYGFGSDFLLKVYRSPDDVLYRGDPQLQKRCRERLKLLTEKLKHFPPNLPERVVSIKDLAWDSPRAGASMVGVIIPLIRDCMTLRELGQASVRKQITENTIRDLFIDLYDTVVATHAQNVVIGDFNDRNLLIQQRKGSVFLIDADSMQYGNFACSTFMPKYIDPLIARWVPNRIQGENGHVEKLRPFTIFSDWYSFALLFWEAMTQVPLFGGVYRPKSKNRQVVEEDERPFRNPPLSVFHKDVRLPPSRDPEILPDEILRWCRLVIEKGVREPFPIRFLEDLRFRPDGYGYLAKTSTPPKPSPPPPPIMPPVLPPKPNSLPGFGTGGTTIILPSPRPTPLPRPSPLGNWLLSRQPRSVQTTQPVVTDVFQTKGMLADVQFQGGRLRYIYNEDNRFRREDGSELVSGPYRLLRKSSFFGECTILALGKQAYFFDPREEPEKVPAELFRGEIPVFDSNERTLFWVQEDRLKALSPTGPIDLAVVPRKFTWIWTGPAFGFGFYFTNKERRAFIFDDTQGRLDVTLPIGQVEVESADCYFTERCVFLVLTIKENRQVKYVCALIDRLGNLLAIETANSGNGGWLDLAPRCAASFDIKGGRVLDGLLTQTADGLVLVCLNQGGFAVAKEYDGTKSMVKSHEKLCFSPGGLYVWNDKSIRLIAQS